jgi:hypothetical protein
VAVISRRTQRNPSMALLKAHEETPRNEDAKGTEKNPDFWI